MSSPRRHPLRWILLFGLAAGCANLIGLSEYEENDDPAGAGAGGDGFSPAGGAGAGEGGSGEGDEGTAGEGGSKSTGGKSAGTGGNPSIAGEGNAGGAGGAEDETGGRRDTGGRRGEGGTRTDIGGSAGAVGTEPLGGSEAGGAATGGAGGDATGGVTPMGGTPASGGTPPTGGTSPTGGSGPGPTTCTLPAFSTACKQCIDNSCDDECDPCLADSECRTLTTCLQNCQNATCLNGCFDAYQDANEAFLSVYDCAFTTCASVCAPFGSPCDSGADCESGYCSTNGGGYCSLPCQSHDDCPTTAWCAEDFDGVTKCMPECEDSLDCEAGYFCGYVQMIDDPSYGVGVIELCTPSGGILEPCDTDSECHASDCTGAGGYCTDSCELIEECPVGAFCVDSSCTIECYDDADCAPYGSVCVTVEDTEGFDVDVCEL